MTAASDAGRLTPAPAGTVVSGAAPGPAVFNRVRRGQYHDSVTLMRLSHDMEAVAGVSRAAAMMGTPQNRALLREAGLLAPAGEEARPTDLVYAVVADTEAAAVAAWEAADAGLARRPDAARSGPRPRTLRGALDALADANLALISVPGPYAAAEAHRALAAGLHVMLFSDNVPVADEVALKRAARARERFMLGPDCGTTLLHGVPLGFANAVPRGRIGVVGASGTGLQAVTCHIAAAGEGVSHAIGLGGRDLSDEVGGLMLEAALAALAADPFTEVVCVVSKPPGPETARRARAWLERLGKPHVLHFIGDPAASTAATLEDAALAAVALARGERGPVAADPPLADLDRAAAGLARALAPPRRFVRGIYAGGSLAAEALALLGAELPGVATHVGADDGGHRVTDLGDDRFTVGRPHPMIDGAVRREWIAREAADPDVAVILLDVVLGYGAHEDPAGELLPAIETARARGRTAVVASVCGTADDRQGLARQVTALERAGVVVAGSNARAARLAARIAARATTTRPPRSRRRADTTP